MQDGSLYLLPCSKVGVSYAGYWTRFRCSTLINAFNSNTGAGDISGRPVASVQVYMADHINGVVILDNITGNGTLIGQG